MTTESDKTIDDAVPGDPGRRKFLNTAAAVGLGGTGLSLGLASCAQETTPGSTSVASGAADGHIKPGQLDEYYGFWSGGHTGDVRVLGLPSGREILRIPVFVPDSLIGWGITNESRAVMGTRPDGSLKYTVGDTHHVHASYRNGTYDGKYAWVNEKINSRLARIRLDTMVCDRILELPNVQGFHGIFPDKRDPVDETIDHTTRVFCGGEYHIPLPNDGRDLDDPEKYRSLFTCVDAESMETRWQVLIDGNCDLVATSFDGKLAASNQYNTEGGARYEDMMSVEHDSCIFFHIERIERAVSEGKFSTYGSSKVPVVDGTRDANKDPKTALTAYVPVAKNPHGVNATPDGKYFVCSGKLSPTGTVIDLASVLKW
ncbi:MAG: TAT-dependent nitrous-oxide reductase, partial [Gammaproteobacteria bacterium]|nr:TAT-dependent nitrous-oxide reductase [Gammaproteobacteria bacterium]